RCGLLCATNAGARSVSVSCHRALRHGKAVEASVSDPENPITTEQAERLRRNAAEHVDEKLRTMREARPHVGRSQDALAGSGQKAKRDMGAERADGVRRGDSRARTSAQEARPDVPRKDAAEAPERVRKDSGSDLTRPRNARETPVFWAHPLDGHRITDRKDARSALDDYAATLRRLSGFVGPDNAEALGK